MTASQYHVSVHQKLLPIRTASKVVIGASIKHTLLSRVVLTSPTCSHKSNCRFKHVTRVNARKANGKNAAACYNHFPSFLKMAKCLYQLGIIATLSRIFWFYFIYRPSLKNDSPRRMKTLRKQHCIFAKLYVIIVSRNLSSLIMTHESPWSYKRNIN